MEVNVKVTLTLSAEVLQLLANLVSGEAPAATKAPVRNLPAAKAPVKTKVEPEDEEEENDEDQVTIEEIREVLTKKKDQGKSVAIKALLAKYNVKSATNLALGDYADFIAKAKKL